MSMNITAASGTSSGIYIDTEYQRIIRELQSLGIESTGSKSTDKTKLEQAKSAQTQNDVQDVQFVSQIEETEKAGALSSQDNIKNDMSVQAQQMTGATQIAELNRYKLLGF